MGASEEMSLGLCYLSCSIREVKICVIYQALVNKMDNGENKFKDIADMEDELQEHPSFLEEDRRMFELQMLAIQELWNKINAKLNLKLER